MEVLNILQKLSNKEPMDGLDNAKTKSSSNTENLKENILIKNNYDYL